MFDSPVLPMIALFLSGAAVLILRGPLGKALADRLARRGPDDRDLHDVRGELDDLRHQLAEVQERLDFAERVLARERQAPALPGREG